MAVDVRTKMLVVVVFTLMALIYQDPRVLGILLVLNLLVLALFRVNLLLLKGFKGFVFMVSGLIIMQSFFIQEGEPLWQVGEAVLLTTGGIYYGISILLRFLVLACSALLLAGSSPQELVLALVKMRVPYEIAFMVLLGIRFMPVMFEELQNTIHSIQLRGVDLRKVYRRKILRFYTNLFSPMIYSVWQKTEKLSILLEMRGFRRFPDRTYYRDIVLTRTDYLIMGFVLMSTAVFVLTVKVFLT